MGDQLKSESLINLTQNRWSRWVRICS